MLVEEYEAGDINEFALQVDPERTSVPPSASQLEISQSANEDGRGQPIRSHDFTNYDKSLGSNCAWDLTAAAIAIVEIRHKVALKANEKDRCNLKTLDTQVLF